MTSSSTGIPSAEPRGDRPAVLAVGTQFWLNGMAYAAVVPRLPDVRDRLGIDVATLGTILTLAALGGLAGSAVSGLVIERLGTKRSIQVGTVATAALLPFVGIVDTPAGLIAVIALLAMFDVIIDIAMNLQGSRLNAVRRTPIMNRLHGLWSTGTVMGGLIAVWAAGAGVSLSAHLLGIAAMLLVVFLVSSRFLLRTDHIPDREDTAAGDPAVPGEAGQAPGVRLGPIRLMLMVLGAAAVTMELTTSDWAAFRLADDLGTDPGLVGLGFVAFTSGMVIGRFAGDTIQAAIGDRLLVRAASLVAATGLALATLLPYRWFTDSTDVATAITAAGFLLAALGVSVIFPQLYDVAARAPGRAGAGLAALTAGTRIAGVVAPIVVGALAATSLSVGTAMALITIPTCALTFLIRPPDGSAPNRTAAAP
ncbi:MAG: MFS transporter [Actinomycetota bacterium]